MKNYLQVYIGNGKGKTTASIGLSVRAVGAGKKVGFFQFLKKGDFSEVLPLRTLGVDLYQLGSGNFIIGEPSQEERVIIGNALNSVRKAIELNSYDIIILDEILDTVTLGLCCQEDIIDLVKKGLINSEVVVTGRNSFDSLTELADLVSKIDDIKHYYTKGVAARKGIEF